MTPKERKQNSRLIEEEATAAHHNFPEAPPYPRVSNHEAGAILRDLAKSAPPKAWDALLLKLAENCRAFRPTAAPGHAEWYPHHAEQLRMAVALRQEIGQY